MRSLHGLHVPMMVRENGAYRWWQTQYAVRPGAYLEEWIDEQSLFRQQVADLLRWGLQAV